jgi:N-acetylmuramoyl-L-alanine amidase
MIVIFDRQHYGKPNRPNDLGAAIDIDGNGVIDNDEKEANITPSYYMPAKEALERLGHSVYILQEGWYSDRHSKANTIARANPNQKVAYIACHVNAGKGDYAVMIHDSRSGNGKRLANAVAGSIGSAGNLEGIRRSLVRAASADNEWKRGYTTIKGIYAGPGNISGICCEPFFIDRPEHQWLASSQGGRALADALVAGLVAWNNG